QYMRGGCEADRPGPDDCDGLPLLHIHETILPEISNYRAKKSGRWLGGGNRATSLVGATFLDEEIDQPAH
ncbi:hypothetical protein, partial [Raoultella ornithinolytica]|uniref:hypothetical protein n=1 Tax=Raoultella ornithinolytica TaxID=54291 RepID=UPI0019541F02